VQDARKCYQDTCQPPQIHEIYRQNDTWHIRKEFTNEQCSHHFLETGHGSGASPAVWLTLAVILMNALDRVIPDRTQFKSPDDLKKHSHLIDAFVDDTSNGITDPQFLTLKTLV
jgi:hypothetical protein